MKIMITGASGFIGGCLLDAAIAAWGADNVIAFSSRQFIKCRSIVYNSGDFGLNDVDKALIEIGRRPDSRRRIHSEKCDRM